LDAKRNVFVCGALQSPSKMVPLLGRRAPFAPAVARGYWHTSEKIKEKNIPFMVPSDPQRVLTGVVWLDLTEQEVRKIETIELDGSFRKSVVIEIQVGDRTIEAITYIKKINVSEQGAPHPAATSLPVAAVASSDTRASLRRWRSQRASTGRLQKHPQP
jgi:hypothetical protein